MGGGPAGLMAAQVLCDAGVTVHLFDAMPSVGRKFLLAGKGGLNLTHSEGADTFAGRYGERFRRMWRYYLLSCAGSFRARHNQLWQIVLAPDGVGGGYRRPA